MCVYSCSCRKRCSADYRKGKNCACCARLFGRWLQNLNFIRQIDRWRYYVHRNNKKMSVSGLKLEIDNLSSSSSLSNSLAYSSKLLQSLHNVHDDLLQNDESSLGQLPKLITNSWNDKLQKEQRQLNSKIKKLDKTVDKFFSFEVDDVYNYKINIDQDIDQGVENKKIIDRAIIIHLLRNGEFKQVDELSQDWKFDIPGELIENFTKLYQILNELQINKLEMAIEWCIENKLKLIKIGSDLEFQLYELKFIQIFINDKYQGLKFAQLNFPKFGFNHLETVSKLVSRLSFQNDENFTDAFYIDKFHKLSKNFITNFCSLQGLSSESPIYSTLIASFLSLPYFIKFNKLINIKKLDWSTKNELPFEIQLPDYMKFHSIFICPVSKEETTLDNPPRVLPCNHILSQSTVINLSKNNLNSSFKCPYCPKITRQLETKLVKFVNI